MDAVAFFLPRTDRVHRLMERDRDIAAALPDPPPPASARRDAAIAAALRNFDGEGDGTPVPVRTRPKPWRPGPRAGTALAAMLVLVIGLPTAWVSIHEAPTSAPSATSPAAPAGVEPAPAATPSVYAGDAQSRDPQRIALADGADAGAPQEPALVAPKARAKPAPPGVAPPAPPTTAPTPIAPARIMMAEPAPSPPAMAEANVAQDRFAQAERETRKSVDSAAVAQGYAMNAAPPAPAARAAPAPSARGEDNHIIVTGSRVTRDRLSSEDVGRSACAAGKAGCRGPLGAIALASIPFAVGTAEDMKQVSRSARACRLNFALGKFDGSPAIFIDRDGLRPGSEGARCFFGKFAKTRLSTEFGLIGNAARE